MSHREVYDTWREYWKKNSGEKLSFDVMSRTILDEMLKSCGDLKGRKILEAGCGRGMISAALAESGADVTLLDISPEALQIARRYFEMQGRRATFILGDIFAPPFDDAAFDIVWNAGVMEHFQGTLQSDAIRELSRILKPGGLFISFNPSADAFFYNMGKRAAEKRGKWPYGPEFPVSGLEQNCRPAGLTVLREYPICFRENLSYLSYVSKHLRSAVKMLLRPFPEDMLMRVFGGYLLVTLAEKSR